MQPRRLSTSAKASRGTHYCLISIRSSSGLVQVVLPSPLVYGSGTRDTGLVEDWVQVLEKYGGDEHGWGRGGRTIFGKSGARMSIGMGRRWGGSEACRGRREKTGAWIWAWAARPILPQSPFFFKRFIVKVVSETLVLSRAPIRRRRLEWGDNLNHTFSQFPRGCWE